MFRKSHALVLVAGLLASTIAGCSHATSTSSSNASAPATTAAAQSQGGPWSAYETFANYAAQHGTVVYQVTYQPNAVVFDQQTTERALKGINEDGTIYTLDASVPQAASLKPGSVLFLYGIAIRKVTAVQTQASNVVATTTNADITDAIKDGHISWETPVDFSLLGMPDNANQPQSFENLFASPALAAGGWSLNLGGQADKFKARADFAYDGQQLNLDLKATYTGPGAIVEMTGTGYINGFSSVGALDIAGGALTSFYSGLKNATGHADFTWSGIRKEGGAQSLIDRQFKIKIPGLSMKYPLIVGGIPFILELSAAMIVHPAFTSKNAITTGHFVVNYNGTAGVTVGTGSPTQGSMQANQTIDHDTSVVSPNAMGFVAALELPRVELSLGVMGLSQLADVLTRAKSYALVMNYSKGAMIKVIEAASLPIKPYAYFNVVTSTGTFTNGALTSSLVALPPCQRAQIVVTGSLGVGVKLNFKHLPGVLSSLQKMTAPKVESSLSYATAPAIFRNSLTAYKNGLKCPGD